MKEIKFTFLGILGGIISSAFFYFVVGFSPATHSEPAVEVQEHISPVHFSALRTESIKELKADFVEASQSSRNSVVYIKTVFESRRSLTWMGFVFWRPRRNSASLKFRFRSDLV